jgi:hypothetical protein
VPPAYRRLSESPLWTAQRRFYETSGVEAWRTGTVPHHVTNSVALAEAYARVVCAFAQDARSREPLHVVELGAGSGRFAFLFLQALARPGRPAPSIRYVMTDVALATIDFWRRHPDFRPFVQAGRLDFARFDAARDTALPLRLARREIAPLTPVERLVVIANYVFSGLPQDAFVSRGGRLYEWLVRSSPQTRRPDGVILEGRPGARATRPYDDDDFNRVLATRPSPRGVDLFPVGALRALRALSALARRDALVLVAERPDGSLGLDPATLGMGRHGAVSFPLDVSALHRWTQPHGGLALTASRRARHLAMAGLLRGRNRRGWTATRAAWRRAMARGGPDALYSRRRALATSPRPTLRALLGLLVGSGHDPRVVAETLRPLWPHLPDASAPVRGRLRDIAVGAWRNHYELGEPHDVAFDLGLLLYGVRAWDDARRLFEAALDSHGGDAATWWNLGLCHVALGNPDAALAAFRRARKLAPGLNPAGPVTVKSPPS